MKRKIQHVVAIVIFAMFAQTAFAATVSIDNIAIDGNVVTVTGTAENADEYVTMVVRNSETKELMTVAEKKINEDKSYVVDFEIPDVYGGMYTDGDYNVTVNLNKSDDEKDSYIFHFVRDAIRSELLDAFNTKAASEIAELINSDELYTGGLEVEGIYGSRFASLDPAEQEYVITATLADKGLEAINYLDIDDDMNFYICFAEMRSGKDVENNLKAINPVFEGKSYSELSEDEQAFIAESVKENISTETYEEFLAEYNDFGILCKLNFARYTDIKETMNTYKEEIGLSENSYYKKYNGLSSNNRQTVNERIVEALGTRVYTFYDFVKIFESKVKSVQSSSGGSSGSGGSGGSGGKGGSSLPSKNTYYEVQAPANSAIRADIEQGQENENLFDDLDGVEWAKEAILSLAEKGIVSGRGNKKFAPNSIVTREEFVKMIVVAADVYDSSAKTDFSDVVSGSWYESYVASAVNNGLVKGQGENMFGVGKAITRQDVCVIAALLINEENIAELTFTDNDSISDYAKESVGKLTSAGIVSGMGYGSFEPLSTCTRAQAAKIVYGILERR